MAARRKGGRKNSKASIPAINFDDALALLLQLEPGDIEGFKELSAALESVYSGGGLDPDISKLVAAAKAHIDRYAGGETSDAEEVLVEASKLLEAATNEREKAAFKKTAAGSSGTPDAGAADGADPQIPQEGKAVSSAAKEPSVSTSLPADADPGLIMEFVAESRELLENSESALLALESNPDDDESVNTVFRAFHTVKGTAGFLGVGLASELAHHAESLLSRIRNKEIRLVGGYADLALRSLDMLKKTVSAVEGSLQGGLLETPNGYEELKSILSDPEAAGISEEAGRQPDFEGSMEESPVSACEDVKTNPELPAAEPVSSARDAVAKAVSKKPAISRSDSEFQSSIRVNTARLDRLIDMVGELVIAQSMVTQDRKLLEEGCHDLLRKVTHAGKIVRELQDLSMSMRMVPLRGTFQKMQRVARDLARKSGKSVDLIVDDGETEIDRHMVDILNDVLVHMVRNAIDHGIESPEEREKNGKNRNGMVRLVAFHSGGSVVVEIRDDGKGLNRDKILAKAVDSGLVDPEKPITDNEVFNLIFAPGLSTSDKLTDVSGRGVGMDVVRKGVEALHGRIDIDSSPGEGSIFTVRLPLTLAITDGMLVRVGSEKYIIPTISIQVSFRPQADSISTVSGRGELVMLRGEMMPIFRLHRLFGIDSAAEDAVDGLLVVVGDEKQRCALLVDELLGQQQVVAKSLTTAVGKIMGVSGGAILGDGQVGLILDPNEVVALARQTSGQYGIPAPYGRPAA